MLAWLDAKSLRRLNKAELAAEIDDHGLNTRYVRHGWPEEHTNGFDLTQKVSEYIARLPVSVEGANGSAALMSALAKIWIKFGADLDDERFRAAAAEYNETRCEPPWNEREIEHAIGSVYKRHPRSNGHERFQRPKPEVKTFATDVELIADYERQHGKISARWPYHNELGVIVQWVFRWDHQHGKDIRPASLVMPNVWVQKAPPRRFLYRVPELIARVAEVVYVCEGEKTADAIRALGLLATTSSGGAQAASRTSWQVLSGRKEVVILRDADGVGLKYANDVRAVLVMVDPKIAMKIILLPGLTDGEDAVEFIQRRREDGKDDPEIRAEIEALGSKQQPEDLENLPDLLCQKHFGTQLGPPHEANATGFIRNYRTATAGGQEIKIGLSQEAISAQVRKVAGNWPKCASGLLFVDDGNFQPRFLETRTQYFAWAASQLLDADNRVHWQNQGESMVSQAQFFEHERNAVEQFDAVEPFPHYPPMPRHCYLHQPIHERDTGAFKELREMFCPATDVDGDLIAAAAMTLLCGIKPGLRPAFLVQATDDDKHGGRGAGKTTLVKALAEIVGGYVELRAGDEWEKIVTRLLSPAALTKRVVLLDNLKTLRFSWAELEAGITGPTISGRQLYTGEGRRINTLTYFITLNGANLSKDMAQRCVPIVLKRPHYDASWEERIAKLVETRRWEIVSDIINALKAPAEPMRVFSRWSAWEAAVLSRVGAPTECQRTIAERQATIDDDQTDTDTVRDGIRAELTRLGHDPDAEVIFIPSKVAAQILNAIENEENRPYGRAMVRLYTLSIPEVRRSNRGEARGCVWVGQQADAGEKAQEINQDPAYSAFRR